MSNSDSFSNALFCDNIGETFSDVRCCYINDQTTPTCRRNFNASGPTFTFGCNNGDCISQCQKPTILYNSAIQDEPSTGNGQAPIQRFRTCVNVPAISGFARQGSLSEDTTAAVGRHIPSGSPNAALANVTNVVTECLTQTCKASRNPSACSGPCSAVNMLVNSTRPNIGGVNECLNKLCTGGYESLPYADADVIGIGVFSSYILQCLLLMLLWLGLYCFSRSNRKHSSTLLSNPHERPSETVQGVESSGDAPLEPAGETITHQSILETCLLQFHISQCYFSATIQIASLAYGIFSEDMLLTFLLIPVSINGILPIVFGMLLLNQRGKASLDITLLSVACWLLSSIVYWVLYSHIIDINSQFDTKGRRYMAYQQFSYKLSAIDSCGGYSALAVCPNTFRVGREDVLDAAWKLSYVTPLIWAFSTITLVLILASMIRAWWEGEKDAYGTETENVHLRPHQISASPLLDPESARGSPATNRNGQQRGSRRIPFLSSGFAHRTYQSKTFHIVTTFLFLLALGIQLSLLSISTSLKMMSRHDWGFGQIVAVAVWVPPLLQYVYDELRVAVKVRRSGRKRGRGRGRSEGISLKKPDG